jgi:hypothetical protein
VEDFSVHPAVPEQFSRAGIFVPQQSQQKVLVSHHPLSQLSALPHGLSDGLAAVGGQPLMETPGGNAHPHPLLDGGA